MKKCSYADRYKAKRAPKCNDGKGCDICKDKWDKELRLRRIEEKLEKLFKRTDPHEQYDPA